MSAEALILAQDLTKRFSAAAPPAIDRLCARIGPGEVTGIVGPDGAGKTTLLRLFAGLLLPSDGKVAVCGADTRTELESIRQQVSYMPQRFGLYEDLSVQQNLNLYADLRDVAGPERQAAFARLLAFTGLEPFTRRLAGALSGGMKQKLGLACALIRPPRLLLLDEPSVGVDPISRRELWKMVYDLVERGHRRRLEHIVPGRSRALRRVFLLHEGKVLYEGPPKELTARVEGRSFLVSGAGRAGRQLLARALERPEIIDGVIQGSSVRLVTREGAQPPAPSDLGAALASVETGSAAIRGRVRRPAGRLQPGMLHPFPGQPSNRDETRQRSSRPTP